MEMNLEIMLACETIIKALDTLKDYSEKLRATQSESMRQVYDKNRMEELLHIQHLIVALTEMLNGSEGQMDEEKDGDDDGNEYLGGEE